jgi:hypothetical protein
MRRKHGFIILLLVVGLTAGSFETATRAEGTRLSPVGDRETAWGNKSQPHPGA